MRKEEGFRKEMQRKKWKDDERTHKKLEQRIQREKRKENAGKQHVSNRPSSPRNRNKRERFGNIITHRTLAGGQEKPPPPKTSGGGEHCMLIKVI